MPPKLLQELTGHTDRVWTISWNPSGTSLATSGADKSIRIWSKSGDKWVCSSILSNTHTKTIRRLCWSPCGQYLASSSFDSTVSIWANDKTDNSWATLVNLEGHESEVKSVAWSHGGKYLASCGRDKSVWIWERATGDQGDLDDDAESWDCSDVKNEHTKDVKHIVWHPNHDILASCSYDDTVKLFHHADDEWKCFQTLTGHSSTVWSVDFSKDGRYLVTCSDDRTVRFWVNLAHDELPNVKNSSWKFLSVIQGQHSRSIYDVSWSKISNMIVSASGDNSLVFYKQTQDSDTNDVLFQSVERLSQSHNSDVNCVEWNPRIDNLLATGSDDCIVKIWDCADLDNQGMPIKQVLDLILERLKGASLGAPDEQNLLGSMQSYNLQITDLDQLKTHLLTIQELQTELGPQDTDAHRVEKELDLRVVLNQRPVESVTARYVDDSNIVDLLRFDVINQQGELRYNINLNVQFKLALPRRCNKMLVVADSIFLLEKTGDLYRIENDGTCELLLGHLFMFSDVKFVIGPDDQIEYIISADRDEKIRITKYPKTYMIERYCFAHRHMIKRLFITSERMLVSMDIKDIVHLWDLNDLSKDDKPIRPQRRLCLSEEPADKKSCAATESLSRTQLTVN